MNTEQRYEPVARQELGESLILAPGALPEVTDAVPLIEIIAPATLPEDYEFPVTMNHQKYLVKVPLGGVEAGQKFSVPMTQMMVQQATTSVPVGHWRDGLLDIFKYGLWHPHWLTATACSLLAAGQVINRLNFTWQGQPSRNTAESARAFNIIFYVTLFHWFTVVVLWLALMILDPNDYDLPEEEWEEPTGTLLFIENAFDFFKFLYFVITTAILFQLRRSVRAKYAIPGTDSDDACTTVCCPCLVAGQLLRHTTDYDTHPARLCTSTGLPEGLADVV